MALETGTYISDLNPSNPVGATDKVSTLDDHIRLIKATLQTTFPGIAGAVTATHTELNFLDGVTGTTGTGKVVLDASPTIANLTVTGSITLPAASVADTALSDNVALLDEAAAFESTLSVAGAATFSSTIAVAGNATIGGNLALTGTLNGVSVTDYPRKSQENTFLGTTQTVSAANATLRVTDGTVDVRMIGLTSVTAGWIGTFSNHDLRIATNNTSRASIDASGVFKYGSYEIGYRDIPTYPGSGSVRGTVLVVSTNQTLSAGFAANATFAYYNDSASSITITQGSGLTLRLAGTNLTGNRTLAAHGWATVWFLSETEAIISGPGVI
jgi:hypothetical protein